MSDVLGILAWWSVSEPTATRGELAPVLDELGLKIREAAHGDVFRRLGEITSVYERSDGLIDHLGLVKVTGDTKTRLERHIVLTVKDRDGVTKLATQVGTAVFQTISDRKKPRLTIKTNPGHGHAAAYAQQLRDAYAELRTALDAQAGRRLTRAFLSNVEAIDLDGVYFIPNPEDGPRLVKLLSAMGGKCQARFVHLHDEPQARETLRAHGWKEQP